ncbi:MAG: FAD-binding oxidoreductase [Chloroflexi bacterium]|nr:FAD-binding oxidoreductase [Chloroflexota bacterium]
MTLPRKIKYLIIGAGVHGLSTGWHLAKELKARGTGSGEDILIVDKTAVAAGASGIACGVIRNFYYQPAMGEVMNVSVDIWESDPEAFHFHQCGYIAVVPETQDDDVVSIYERQQKGGFDSSLVQGEQNVFSYMRNIFPDWQARGLTSLLHEHRSGFAFNSASMFGIANKAEAEGVTIETGVQVKGFAFDSSNAVTKVETNRGEIEVEHVIVAVGPWVAQIWEMLGLSDKVDILGQDGRLHTNQEMWTYWRLLEGALRIDPKEYVTADGKMPPVFHFDSREPLISLQSGKKLNDPDGLWGVYWKQDRHGVQGGAAPENLGHTAQVDPYGPASPEYVVGTDFVDVWTSGLAHAIERFEGCHMVYDHVPSGGIGCFTADSFPIFDYAPGVSNVYVVADSNHGFKMIGVGKEVARVLVGEHSNILHPFRYSRFAEGDLHPVSKSPYPWG